MSRTLVYCTFDFEGFHAWPEAPDEVAFLRTPHRHQFHVRAEVEVAHQDRHVEFILLKRELARACTVRCSEAREAVERWSCEQWAQWLLDTFNLYRVEVSEDDENGAVVER